MKRLRIRLFSIWKILTSKNFILLHSIEEYTKENEKRRKFRIIRRTNYTDESDLLTLVGAVKTLKEKYNL